jgi:molecular chaperone DnaK
MVKDAAAHATEDQTRRDLIDARNQADTLAYQVERTVNEHRDRMPATEVAAIESRIAAVRQAVAGDDVAAMKRATDDLQQASHAMAQQLYTQQRPGPGQGRGTTDNDVKDGEVVEA